MMKLGTVVPCLFIILPSALKIYISKEKGWKLKVRKFWWLTPTFVEATREKLVRRLFVPVMSWSSRKKWKFIFSNVYSVPRKFLQRLYFISMYRVLNKLSENIYFSKSKALLHIIVIRNRKIACKVVWIKYF